MFYWMDNYPQDFDYIVENPENQGNQLDISGVKSNHHQEPLANSFGHPSATQSINSYNSSLASVGSSGDSRTNATTDSEINNLAEIVSGNSGLDNTRASTTASLSSRLSSLATDDASNVDQQMNQLNRKVSNLSIGTNTSHSRDSNHQSEKSGSLQLDELLRLSQDEHIKKRALKLNQIKRGVMSTSGSVDSTGSETVGRGKSSSGRHHHQQSSKNSAVLDLDSRYVAQQLTAIDLTDFLNLCPYSLLDGSRSNNRVQA